MSPSKQYMILRANLLLDQEEVGFCCFCIVTPHWGSYPVSGYICSIAGRHFCRANRV
jgi:hypothetical protein